MKEKFSVTGMSCASCSAHVEKSVSKLEGVRSVAVNLLQNTMLVDWDEKVLTSERICKAVSDAGYGAEPAAEDAGAGRPPVSGRDRSEHRAADEFMELKHRLIASVCFLVPLMLISMGHMMGMPLPAFLTGLPNAVSFAMTQFLLTIPIMIINRRFYTSGFRSLFRGAPNMDSLIALGSSAAVIYGIAAIYGIGYGLGHGDLALVERWHMDLYFESAGTILTLITVGKMLEARAKGHTSDALSKLLDLAPETAVVERDGKETEVPAGEVRVGDIVVVRPGGRIAADGVIVFGESALDESALTGESLPVDKSVGDRVISASINRSGYLKYRAERVGGDTTLAQIVKLVEDANAGKAPIARLADRVAGVFVPVVLVIAAVTLTVWLLAGREIGFALSNAIAVLVISCPCALGLATPTAIMVGTGKGAENGILYKTAESLETLKGIDTAVLDKTGTVTEGKPEVTDLLPADGVSEQDLLRLAAAAEKQSEHPLADAVVRAAAERKIALPDAAGFEALPGMGVRASVGGKAVTAGSLKLMAQDGLTAADFRADTDTLADSGKTPLFFAADGKPLGVIAAADVAKKTSRDAVAQLEALGIEVVLLTGDNLRTAKAVCRETGIRRAVAQVMPQDKAAEISALQKAGRKVAMIGDGINDAPALAQADVGIAIGAGTDIAIESADIVLMKSDLQDAATAVQLSRSVMRNIRENLFWALFYNSIGIPLAAGLLYPVWGIRLNPMFGAAAMSLSSFCVVTNALRLRFFRPKKNPAPPDPEPADIECRTAAEAPVSVCPVFNTETKTEKEVSEMKKTLKVDGMMCDNCRKHVQKALAGVDGVAKADVDLKSGSAVVELSKEVPDEALKAAVAEAGYEVTSVGSAV